MQRRFFVSDPPRRDAGGAGVVPAICVALLFIIVAAPTMAQGITRDATRLQLTLDSAKPTAVVASSDVWCSDVFLGSGIARLNWAFPDKAADSAAAVPTVRAEVTMYPEGFANKKFSTYEARRATTRPGESPMKALVDAPPLADGSPYVVVRDLQPGVLYRWRLAVQTDKGTVTSETLEFRGPICPVDSEMDSEPEAAHPRPEVQR